MEKHMVSRGLVFLGIFLLTAGIILGPSIELKLKDMNGSYSMNKVGISLKKEGAADRKNIFTQEDIKSIKTFLKTDNLTFLAEDSTILKSDKKEREVNVKGVKYNYKNFITLDIIRGNFFTEEDEYERNRVVVIEERLALELFNTDRVIGKKIEILDKKFEIIGVVSKDESLIQTLVESDEYKVYIPLEVLLDLDIEVGITAFQLGTKNDLLGNSKEVVTAALSSIGKIKENYIIEDYQVKSAELEQKILLLTFILGLLLIASLAILVKNKVGELIKLIQASKNQEYLYDAVKSNIVRIAKILFWLIIFVTSIILIWKGIRFKLYLPQEYIPEELFDFSYYIDLIKAMILHNNAMVGNIPTLEQLIFSKAQFLINSVVCITIIAGIPTFYIGLYQLKQEGTGTLKSSFLCSVFACGSISVISIIALGFGVQLKLGLNSLTVLYAFIFVNSILFSKEREEVF